MLISIGNVLRLRNDHTRCNGNFSVKDSIHVPLESHFESPKGKPVDVKYHLRLLGIYFLRRPCPDSNADHASQDIVEATVILAVPQLDSRFTRVSFGSFIHQPRALLTFVGPGKTPYRKDPVWT
ncbi:hypothetical protein RHECNPAF_1760015 [Rhizobium etli CNPAF512]|nr:hypothetical protein RHECNPAF_1760015 [Rhizobium etli CNPAF512]